MTRHHKMNDQECDALKAKLAKELRNANQLRKNASTELSKLKNTISSKLATMVLCECAQHNMRVTEKNYLGVDERVFQKEELICRVKDDLLTKTYNRGIAGFEEALKTFPAQFNRDFAHRKFDELITRCRSAIDEANAKISNAHFAVKMALRECERAKSSLESHY